MVQSETPELKELRAKSRALLNDAFREFRKNPCALNYVTLVTRMMQYQHVIKNYGNT
jgi:hypothetical protein